MPPIRTKLAPQPSPFARMSLRSFRNVSMDSSSSSSSNSDDSCDSFGSDGGLANTRTSARLTNRRAAPRCKVFKATPEEDALDGFAEIAFNKHMSALTVDSPRKRGRPPKVVTKSPAKVATKSPAKVATKPPAKVATKPPAKIATKPPAKGAGFTETTLKNVLRAMEVDSEPPAEPCRGRGRPSLGLKVAMKFPTKGDSQKKRPASAPLSQPPQQPDSDSEGESFMDKRALNIKENKAMLAKLMAELNKMPAGLIPKRVYTPRPRQHPPAPSRRSQRTSRPHTRSRSLVDGPPSSAPDSEEEDDKFSLVRRSRNYEEVDEPREPRRRTYNGVLAIPHVVRPVEDITQDELDLICTIVKDKVYNSSTGVTCHQCRQKTTDTKTNCRNPECTGVRGQFCGPCLRNRYGEEVRDALLDPEWTCPPCRGICNCSFCRAREGRCATGVLVYLAKFHGHDNVHAYLKSLKKQLDEESED